MLPELSESQAEGEIARIYAEVRTLCAVPYVSSLHRHLATRPGWLEWCWAAVRPAFVNGKAQNAAWAAAAGARVPPLPAISASALRLMGVDAAARDSIRAVCESFVRVSPTNLMFVALVRAQLRRVGGAAIRDAASSWTPPPALPELPEMVDMDSAGADLRATLLQLRNTVAGQPFVPGLYRMLGHWPAYLAHVATVLGPRFDDPRIVQACHALAGRVDAASASVAAGLPPPPAAVPRPSVDEHADVLAVMERYRKTSPEMVVLGALLRDALPAASRPGAAHGAGES